jgi:hypothetical protein
MGLLALAVLPALLASDRSDRHVAEEARAQ